METKRVTVLKPAGKACPLGEKCTVYRICSHVCALDASQPYRVIHYLRNSTSMRNERKGLMVLTAGFLASTINTESGFRDVYLVHSPGAVLGEVALYQDEEVPDNLLAIVDADLCHLPTQLVKEAIAKDGRLFKELIDAAARNEQAFGMQIWILRGNHMQDRRARFFASRRVMGYGKPSGRLSIPISHEILALIINSERASVSRLLKDMEKQGLLDIKSRRIVIKGAYWTSKYNTVDNRWHSESS
jgi:CRP-like cAMP-binding protein